MGREHGQAGVLERDQAHEDVAVVALAADLLRVCLHRLIAVMAVGDQQLRVLRGRLHRGDRLRVGHAPDAMNGLRGVAHLAPRRLAGRRLERAPGGVRRIGEQREDGRDVRARRARETKTVLLGSGMRALVRANLAGAIALDAHAAEEAAARARLPVGARVPLRVSPQRRLVSRARARPDAASSQTARRPACRGRRSPCGRSTATTLNGERASSAARC